MIPHPPILFTVTSTNAPLLHLPERAGDWAGWLIVELRCGSLRHTIKLPELVNAVEAESPEQLARRIGDNLDCDATEKLWTAAGDYYASGLIDRPSVRRMVLLIAQVYEQILDRRAEANR